MRPALRHRYLRLLCRLDQLSNKAKAAIDSLPKSDPDRQKIGWRLTELRRMQDQVERRLEDERSRASGRIQQLAN